MKSTSYMLRDLPVEERPRERMMEFGPGALSNAELLAILLRTGTRSESAIHMAQRVLSEIGGIRGLVDFSLDEMVQLKGIGPAKAIELKAGIELGRRLAKSRLPESETIRSPHIAAELLMEQMRYLQKEHFVCLFLNTKNHIIAQETLSIGSLNASIVHPREVFRAAIKCGSASVVCAHNHPSGDPTPSAEDIRMTNRLCEAGEIVGIDVLDHIVIGDGKFVSLKEQGLM
ncbi:RadC family protein [Paenibacillus macerans]|uniref:DNA repair RadC family protein n=1 Tax=Paenibacillus macerans TaxID=44252 RepID=A0A090ZKH5_PAEMA|nr:DNA repair protein RadC [Paenibacillus macerans]KFN11087.1 DNA repair RadC family protein [Paenibacillus macerans]MCY7562726.1 DNA repair protein RadC [Paenibacillus macerans]MEC0151226.1 DNA repair protein RadC [Paenibacillus macerans]SUD26618.1 DNA repair protein RadC [Paenibacillus macerans]